MIANRLPRARSLTVLPGMRLGKLGKSALDYREALGGECAVASSQGSKRAIEVASNVETIDDAAHADDFGSDRQRCDELPSLHWLRCFRQNRQATINVILPVRDPWARTGRKVAQVTQGKGQQATGTSGWRERRKHSKSDRCRQQTTRNGHRRIVELLGDRRSSGSRPLGVW